MERTTVPSTSITEQLAAVTTWHIAPSDDIFTRPFRIAQMVVMDEINDLCMDHGPEHRECCDKDEDCYEALAAWVLKSTTIHGQVFGDRFGGIFAMSAGGAI